MTNTLLWGTCRQPWTRWFGSPRVASKSGNRHRVTSNGGSFHKHVPERNARVTAPLGCGHNVRNLPGGSRILSGKNKPIEWPYRTRVAGSSPASPLPYPLREPTCRLKSLNCDLHVNQLRHEKWRNNKCYFSAEGDVGPIQECNLKNDGPVYQNK